MWGVGQDISYAIRFMFRRARLSLAAILTLALGIGATTAVVSVLEVVFLRPVPYPNPDTLVDVTIEGRAGDGTVVETSPSIAEMHAWSRSGTFLQLSAWRFGPNSVVEDGPRPERVRAQHVRLVTPGYFEMLGVRPEIGEPFAPSDLFDETNARVILGHAYWQRRYGGDPGVIGRTLRIQGKATTVAGVMPETFFQGQREREVRLWMPLTVSAADAPTRDSRIHVQGRLKDGDIARAVTQLGTLAPSTAETIAAAQIRLTSFAENAARDVNHFNVQILSASVLVILFLVCINVAGLSLARGAQRSGELAIRASLGASRPRLFRQVLTETVSLTVIGGVIGLAIAWLFLEVLIANLAALLPINAVATLNLRVLSVAGGLTLLIGILVGLVPAARLSDVRAGLLHSSQRTQVSSISGWTGTWLVSIQVALAITVLTGAGLMIKSLVGVLSKSPGFDSNAALVLEVRPIDSNAASTAGKDVPFLLQRIQELPGVEAVGLADRLGSGAARQPAVALGQTLPVSVRRVDAGFLRALGVPLRYGRFPIPGDLAASGSRIVIGELVARKLFPTQSAIGELLELNKITREIVGVVGDVNYAAPYGSPQPEVYVLTDQAYGSSVAAVIVRPRDQSPSTLDDVRKTVERTAPRMTLDTLQTATERLWSFEVVGVRRQQTIMLGLLAAVGFLLAIVGVFAITMQAAVRRTHEIGVRLALGARPMSVLRVVVAPALKAAGGGVVIGLFGSVVTTKLVSGLLFETSPLDLVTLSSVAAAMMVAVCAAAWLPARRAMQIDPGAVLKSG